MYDKFLHSFSCRLIIDGTSHQHYIPYQMRNRISIVIFSKFKSIFSKSENSTAIHTSEI